MEAILEICGHIEMIWILNSICVINFTFLMTKYIANSTKSSLWPCDAILRQDVMNWKPMAAIVEIGGLIEMFWILNCICLINFNFLMTKYITYSTKSSFWSHDATFRQDDMKRRPKTAILEIGGHIEAVRIFWEFEKNNWYPIGLTCITVFLNISVTVGCWAYSGHSMRYRSTKIQWCRWLFVEGFVRRNTVPHRQGGQQANRLCDGLPSFWSFMSRIIPFNCLKLVPLNLRCHQEQMDLFLSCFICTYVE